MGKKLTESFIRKAESGFYSDGGCPTLNLRVMPSGSRQWVQRINIHGRERALGLGGWPVVTLTEARDLALDNRRRVRRGEEPTGGRRKSSNPTLKEIAKEVIQFRSEGWTDGGKSAKQWRASLEQYVFPVLGSRPVSDITTPDILKVLRPIWATKNVTARRIQNRISTIMKWSIAQGHRTDDPAGVTLSATLPKIANRINHLTALPYSKVEGALTKVRLSKDGPATILALEFLVLTAARSGEIRGAHWSEIDLKGKVWTIPAKRMKMKRAHRAPLSDKAIKVLKSTASFKNKKGLIFPTTQGKPMTDDKLSRVLRGLKIKCVPHGFRSSFRDWAAEKTGVPREIVELALAHDNSNKVEAAYRRTDYFERRRELMQRWADFINTKR